MAYILASLMRKSGYSFIGLIAFWISPHAQAAPDMTDPVAVFEMVKARLPYACTSTMDITFEGQETAPTLTMRHDPDHSNAWALMAVNGEPASEQQRVELQPPQGLIPEGTGPLATLLEADFVFEGASDERLTYRAESLPRGSVRVNNIDVSKFMRAELVVDVSGMRTHVLETKLIAKHPFRFRLLARVTEALETRRYTLIDDQWLVPSDITLTYSARMLGRTIEERETRHFTDIACGA